MIRDNTVSGIGPQDGDAIPDPNANEIILTEAYRLHFEGFPSALSTDGLTLQVPSVQGDPASSGDVVAILSGPDAGQWRRISQVIGPSAFLLDSPLPAGRYAISIVSGFVGETFEGNTIDARGSSVADDLVLAGDHFGAQVVGNTLLGGNRGLRIEATPTEAPVLWGWSHAPFLGALVQGNTIEDTATGALISVDHGAGIKADAGRTYLSLSLIDNTFVWSDAFLAARAKAGNAGPPTALTVGDAGSADPGELLLTSQGNEVEGGAAPISGAPMQVVSAILNGQPMTDQSIVLPNPPGPPADLRLVDDSGTSATDGVTDDARLAFVPAPSAVSYESSTTGINGSYLPVTTPASFLPDGLVEGVDTVYVRAYDAGGRRGASTSISFTYDATPPPAVTGLAADATGHVQFQPAEAGDVYAYRVGTSGAFIPLGASTSFTDPTIVNAPRQVTVHAIDAAGNVGPDSTAIVPPSPSPGPTASPPSPPANTPPLSNGSMIGAVPTLIAPFSNRYEWSWPKGVSKVVRPILHGRGAAPKPSPIKHATKTAAMGRVQASHASAHAPRVALAIHRRKPG